MEASKPLIPDGGYGWVIVAAVAFINMTNQSILSVFGLLFASELKEMQRETFTAALVTNLNSLVLNFSGFFIGPAIKTFKPRNVTSAGCIMVSFGLLLCALSTKGWHFIIGYSFFVGMGLGLIAPSTFMAINSYFLEKRGKAVGISLAGAGLGQVLMPHIVRIFLEHYGFRFAVIAMSMLSLSGLIGALLLKPLKIVCHNPSQHIKLINNDTKESKNDSLREITIATDSDLKKNEDKSGKEIYYKIEQAHIKKDYKECSEKFNEGVPSCQHFVFSEGSIRAHKEKPRKNIFQRLIQDMDLELLKDPTFWSIIIGMALVYTSTLNFTMVFPSFLQNSVGFTKSTTASCMSIMAGADIICRLLLPCITDKLKIPYRVIFLLGTVGLLISRAALAESVELTTIIVMSVFTGMTKSGTVLNNNLTISTYVQREKLPGALGLNMISKGILVITVGQLLGWIRDLTDSYVLCLHAQNGLLLLVVVIWTPEIIVRYRNYNKIEKTTEFNSNNYKC